MHRQQSRDLISLIHRPMAGPARFLFPMIWPRRSRVAAPAGLSLIGWAGGDEALLNLACGLSRFCGVVT
jgi:hypothetical protein